MTHRVARIFRLSLVTLALAGAAAMFATFPVAPVHAQSHGDQVESLLNEAIEHYDMLELKAAETKLEEAIGIDREGASEALIARVHVMLGIVRFASSRDEQMARAQFVEAIKLDPDVEIDPLYRTPTLEQVMTAARDEVEPRQPSPASDTVEASSAVEFSHEPIDSAEAGEPLEIEATVPNDLPVQSVEFGYRRYDQKDFTIVEMKRVDVTAYEYEMAGEDVRTSQINYYIQVVSGSGEVLAESGTPSHPHDIVVLGSSDPPTAKLDGGVDTYEGEKKKGGGYLFASIGTGLGFLTGGDPTANPNRTVQPGFAPSIGHLTFEGGYRISDRVHVGIYLRYQMLPVQQFGSLRSRLDTSGVFSTEEQCFGVGIKGDCLLGAKARWVFWDASDFRMYSSSGLGVGRVRNWLRLKERASSQFCQDRPDEIENGQYCYRRDTMRPGWLHLGAGLGASYPINDTVALTADTYLQFLVPDIGFNLDVNVGTTLRF